MLMYPFSDIFINAADAWFFCSWKIVEADRYDGNQVHYLGPTQSLSMNSSQTRWFQLNSLFKKLDQLFIVVRFAFGLNLFLVKKVLSS